LSPSLRFDTRSNPAYEEPHEFQTNPAERRKQRRRSRLAVRSRGTSARATGAIYLGVSVQTVYLWVERKQIPHLRVMARNIRFPRADSRALPRNLQTRGGRWQDRSGKRIRESTFIEDWQEANKKLRERLGPRDNRVLEIVRKGEQMGFEPMPGIFPGELFQGAHARCQDSQRQPASHETPERLRFRAANWLISPPMESSCTAQAASGPRADQDNRRLH
jgi:excisionase family DNA binding protein